MLETLRKVSTGALDGCEIIKVAVQEEEEISGIYQNRGQGRHPPPPKRHTQLLASNKPSLLFLLV